MVEIYVLLPRIDSTPGDHMKRPVNDLLISDEIMNGKHEEANERTGKIIKGESSAVQYLFRYANFTLQALQVYYFADNGNKIDGFLGKKLSKAINDVAVHFEINVCMFFC